MTVAPKPADDRRIAERWNLSKPVRVEDALGGVPMGNIVNLSMQGLTLIGATAYPCGMHIFRLSPPDALKLKQLIAAFAAPVNNN